MAKKIRLLVMTIVAVTLAVSSFAIIRAHGKDVAFASTQFDVVEEAEKARKILADFKDGNAKFIPAEEAAILTQLTAESQTGKGTYDVIGALHGTYPTIVAGDMLLNTSDLLADIQKTTEVDKTFVELAKMGTKDVQYYIPWMQATYLMAANKDALQYLPQGADINNLTWAQLAAWGKTMQEKTGKPQLGFPVKGLFPRFLEGYAWPSYTGGMVTKFKSKEASEMMRFLRDDLWPYVNPESINCDFMQEPLLSGAVMVAWDHVARLTKAFDTSPDKFVAFPAPAGPAGRGNLPVVAGLAIPLTSPNPDGAKALIKYMLSAATQRAVMVNLGFYPVIGGIDMIGLPAGVVARAAAVDLQTKAKDSIRSLLPVGLGKRGGELNQIFLGAFNRVVNNKEDIDKVLGEEGANLQKLLTETGAPCWAPDKPSKGPCQVE